jgi:hypothetical protein
VPSLVHFSGLEIARVGEERIVRFLVGPIGVIGPKRHVSRVGPVRLNNVLRREIIATLARLP